MRVPDSTGVLADGRPLAFDWTDPVHTIISGRTGSGKSAGLYGVLLRAAADPRVQVWGVDPGEVTLNPFAAAHPDRFVLGTASGEAVVALLTRLVEIMTDRLARLRRLGVDKVPSQLYSPEIPTILVVLEEWGGTFTAYERKVTQQIAALVGRLLREARKTGISVATVLQRPEAALLPDRAQYGRVLDYALDNADSVRMTMPTASPADIEWLTSKIPAGQGLLLDPNLGGPHRFRSAWLPYEAYTAGVRQLLRQRA
ncbi:MAG: hypothetical protein ACFWTS_04585 [Pseudoclavibacter caeni]|jgi:hypothetical protein